VVEVVLVVLGGFVVLGVTVVLVLVVLVVVDVLPGLLKRGVAEVFAGLRKMGAAPAASARAETTVVITRRGRGRFIARSSATSGQPLRRVVLSKNTRISANTGRRCSGFCN
jgi:hypothetical protein